MSQPEELNCNEYLPEDTVVEVYSCCSSTARFRVIPMRSKVVETEFVSVFTTYPFAFSNIVGNADLRSLREERFIEGGVHGYLPAFHSCILPTLFPRSLQRIVDIDRQCRT